MPIYTEDAEKIQIKLLKENENKDISNIFQKGKKIDNVDDYSTLLKNIDDAIFDNQYESIIVDITHGFRHIPIFATINLIMANMTNLDKIEHIYYAKEIQIEDKKEYHIVDIKEYLDLANISYILTTFDKNYTVANNVKVTNKSLNDFIDDLENFSKHILANSIDELMKNTNKKRSIVFRLILQIESLLKSENLIFKNLNRLLQDTLKHIKQIEQYSKEVSFKQLYYLAENMFTKGYLLNSITLLSEAIGMYCSLGLKNIDKKLAKKIEEFEKKAIAEKNNEKIIYKLYDLYNQAKALYNVSNYDGIFLKVKTRYIKNPKNRQKADEWNQSVKDLTHLIKIKIKKNDKLKQLIMDIDNIRNNLAHANSSKRLIDVESDIKKVLKLYKKICIDKNILQVKDI